MKMAQFWPTFGAVNLSYQLNSIFVLAYLPSFVRVGWSPVSLGFLVVSIAMVFAKKHLKPLVN